MEYTQFGETDLTVSRICFGTWAFGGEWGSFDDEQAIAAIREARNLGINFFDTAQAYGFGTAERVLGRGLQEEIRNNREEVVIATKGGLRDEGPRPRDASAPWLRQGLQESLEYLGTNYVDLYQIHWPDRKTPTEESAGALDEFIQDGHVHYAGVSNYSVEQMERFQDERPLDSLQPPYHMFRRDIEDDILPYCHDEGIGVLVYAPLAHGLLTGKYTPDTTFPPDDWRSRSSIFQGDRFQQNLEVVDTLQDFAHDHNQTLPQLAIAWTLAHPAVDCAIVGARRPDQIRETAEAAEIELTDDNLDEIDDILADAVPVGGPTPEGV